MEQGQHGMQQGLHNMEQGLRNMKQGSHNMEQGLSSQDMSCVTTMVAYFQQKTEHITTRSLPTIFAVLRELRDFQ